MQQQTGVQVKAVVEVAPLDQKPSLMIIRPSLEKTRSSKPQKAPVQNNKTVSESKKQSTKLLEPEPAVAVKTQVLKVAPAPVPPSPCPPATTNKSIEPIKVQLQAVPKSKPEPLVSVAPCSQKQSVSP